jgi:zinc/manganese transport system substrate-binding protein
MSLICFSGLLLVAGCSSSGEDEADVVATTTHVADIARQVAGQRADVVGILAPNSDPHDYEPRPSDVEALSGASVVVTSGGEVDEWVDELIESSGTDAEVISLLDAAPITRTLDGETDPHWWQDPRNAVAAAEAVRVALTESDPEGESEYAGNASALIRQIERFDRFAAECISDIPERDRKLVSAHDSLGYLADRYDIEIVGAAIPALSTQAQPSSGETSELVSLLESEGVPAVFPEAGLSGDLERAIADEAGVEVGAPLHADALGEDGTGAETFLGAFATNLSALSRGLSGGAMSCDVLGVP